jgi:hypothetical protein
VIATRLTTPVALRREATYVHLAAKNTLALLG